MASFMTTTSKSLLLLALILFLVKASATNDPETCAWKHGSGKECANPDATETNSSKATSTGTPGICVDDRDECAAHAARGDCKTNPRFMLAHCKFSCNACPKNLKYFETDWGEPQESSGSKTAQIEEVIHETETYMKEKVYKQAMYISVRNECLNRDKLCSKWASEGECKKNPQWMHIHCAPAW